MAVKSPARRQAASPTAGGSAAPRPLKVVETVNSEGSWCCIARSPSLPSSPSTPSSRLLRSKELRKASATEATAHHSNGEHAPRTISSEPSRDALGSKVEKKTRSGEVNNRIGDAYKNGEIASLLKQGFISGGSPLDRGNGSPFKIRLSPGRVSPLLDASAPPLLAAPNFSKLNSLLNSGLLSQSSPPIDKARSSPTLFEMMAHEHEKQEKAQFNSGPLPHGSSQPVRNFGKQLSLQERLLSANSPGSKFNDPFSSDVKLTLSSSNKDGPTVTVNIHGQILAANSRYFAAKLSEKWSKQPQDVPHIVHISDCEDVEAYVETLRLMYCTNLKKKLMKESVARVLSILKVSAAIVFEAGVLSCLEYLEAVPWAEEEEEKVTSLLAQLRLDSIGAGEVLKRLSVEDSAGGSQDILVRLLHLVTKGTDEKARREMKSLVSRMLRENAAQGKDSNDLSKESLYYACHGCLDALLQCFIQATSPDKLKEERGVLMAETVRQADNLNWLLEIMIDRQIADDFVRIWAYQKELFTLHSHVPLALGRYELSKLTARLCVAVGQGEVMAPKEVRFQLLHNWLQPLIDDFGWMQRACRGLDRKVVEEGISQTILTLPLKQQQTIMIAWFDRFLKNGDDCPNLQRAFEIWWRRTFVRPQLDVGASPNPAMMQSLNTGDTPKEASAQQTDS